MLTKTYTHLLELAKRSVPWYQFTAIDIRTRIKFLAYGKQKNFSNTWAFIVLIMDGKIPSEYAKEIMPEISPNIALFPPVILDNLSSSS